MRVGNFISFFVQVLDKNAEKFAEARFHGSVAGSVWFRWLGGQAGEDTTDTIIYANLQHTADQKSNDVYFTEHRWKIYVTDIFDDKGKVKKFIFHGYHSFFFMIFEMTIPKTFFIKIFINFN